MIATVNPALRRALSEGTLDRVLLLSVDRVGGTPAELLRFLETCRVSHVALWLDDEKLDTASANGMSLLDLAELLERHHGKRGASKSFGDCRQRGACRSNWADLRFREQKSRR